MNTLIKRLVTEELGFCCLYSFLKETKKYSGRSVAAALGVTPGGLYAHINRYKSREYKPCPNCRYPQTQLELSYSVSGRPYFVRHQLGSSSEN